MTAIQIQVENLNKLSLRSREIVILQLNNAFNKVILNVNKHIENEQIDLIVKDKDKTINELTSTLANITKNEIDNLNLNEIYIENKEDFEKWIKSFDWHNDTTVKHINKCRKIFIEKEIKTVRNYKIYAKNERVATIHSFSKFIEFLR